MRDASLDEFLSTDEGTEAPGGEAEEDEDEDDGVDEFGTEQSGSDSEPEPDATAKPEPEGPGETEPGPDPGKGARTEHDPETEGLPPVDGVEPARSTFAWSPGGGACAECGERVEERWESEAGMVCVECKRW